MEWWDRWESLSAESGTPEEKEVLRIGRRWAVELQALMRATLARLEGNSAGSREWEDEAYGTVLGASSGYQEFGLEIGRIDRICEEHKVQKVVLFPSVLRRELEPGSRVEALGCGVCIYYGLGSESI